MAPQLYLITPEQPDPARFARQLMAVLSGPQVAALLVRRGALAEADHAALAAQLVQIGQAAGAAVLIEDDIALARRLGADGVHVSTGGLKAVREAVAALKPDGIVGVGNLRSRHDAMSSGELDVDYVMFGPLAGEAEAGTAELSQWWAETFEVPAVHSDPAMRPEAVAEAKAEFVALSDSIWAGDDPVAALAAFERALREPA